MHITDELMESKYFSDFEVGETYETTARTITETDLLNYAGLSGNFDSIHLDKNRMEDSEFGGRLVYGQLILVIMEGLRIGTGMIEDSVISSYGLDDVRFIEPVLIGDTIHNEMTVADLERRGENNGIVVMEERAVNQDGKTVVVATTRTLIKDVV